MKIWAKISRWKDEQRNTAAWKIKVVSIVFIHDKIRKTWDQFKHHNTFFLCWNGRCIFGDAGPQIMAPIMHRNDSIMVLSEEYNCLGWCISINPSFSLEFQTLSMHNTHRIHICTPISLPSHKSSAKLFRKFSAKRGSLFTTSNAARGFCYPPISVAERSAVDQSTRNDSWRKAGSGCSEYGQAVKNERFGRRNWAVQK